MPATVYSNAWPQDAQYLPQQLLQKDFTSTHTCGTDTQAPLKEAQLPATLREPLRGEEKHGRNSGAGARGALPGAGQQHRQPRCSSVPCPLPRPHPPCTGGKGLPAAPIPVTAEAPRTSGAQGGRTADSGPAAPHGRTGAGRLLLEKGEAVRTGAAKAGPDQTQPNWAAGSAQG